MPHFEKEEKELRRNTIGLYFLLVVVFKFGMSFVNATYVLFLIHHGLNLFQVNMVNMIFFITMLVCEIPTGAFADIFGRRTAYIIACLLRTVSGVVYAFSTSFAGFAIAESICAIGRTCESGAFRSWLVDRLHHYGHPDEDLGRIFSRADCAGWIACIIAVPLGARVSNISSTYPWLIMSGIMIINAIIAFFCMKEEYFKPQKTSFIKDMQRMYRTTVAGIKYARKNEVVSFLILAGLIQMIAVQAPNMQWAPHFKKLFMGSNMAVGYFGGGMVMFMAIGSIISAKFLKTARGEKWAIVVTQVMVGLCIALTAIFTNLPMAMSFFLIHEVGRGMYKPMKDAYLHDSIKGCDRATVDSCSEVSGHIGGIAGLLLSGMLAQNTSIPLTWISSGLFLAVGTVCAARICRRK